MAAPMPRRYAKMLLPSVSSNLNGTTTRDMSVHMAAERGEAAAAAALLFVARVVVELNGMNPQTTAINYNARPRVQQLCPRFMVLASRGYARGRQQRRLAARRRSSRRFCHESRQQMRVERVSSVRWLLLLVRADAQRRWVAGSGAV